MEDLNNLVQGSYEHNSYLFAEHFSQKQNAIKALLKSNELKIGRKDFIQLHRDFLSEKGLEEEHIKEQLKRVKDLKIYFNAD